ncbi:MAG TPA: ROK family protein [Ktedonobacterales bacterium]
MPLPLTAPNGDSNATRPAFGVEIADSATRFTLTSGESPRTRRWRVRLPSPATPAEATDTIASLIERALREEYAAAGTPTPPVALGVALEDAVVESRTGVVHQLRRAPGWEDMAFAEQLGERLAASVQLASATNAAAVAEARIGAGRGIAGAAPVLYVLLARTLTSAVVVGGRYLEGAHGAQGQLGHVLVRAGGPRCSCGVNGHLEPLASAQSLVRNLIGRASASDESTEAMLRVSGGRAEAMTAAQVVQLAAEGEPVARRVLDEALDGLAPVLTTQLITLGPAILIVGGPLAAAGERFLAPLRERVTALCAPSSTLAELRAGELEPFAALLGARLLAAGDGILH